MGARRLQKTFQELTTRGKTGIIPFITGGFPDMPTTLELVPALARGGADIIELDAVVTSDDRLVVNHDTSINQHNCFIPGEAAGAIGAVGPVRMEYSRAIASVELMADMMSQMVGVVHGVQ